MSVRQCSARVAALTRDREESDPVLVDARRDLAAAKLEDFVRRTVDTAPPLSDEQRARIARLLQPTAGGDAS